jgi:putative transposase
MRALLGATVGWVARRPRIEVAGGYYHVFARGNERRAIYRDDNDRTSFLELLAEVTEGFGWAILSYCLMTNHYHLVIRTTEPNLAAGMHRLNALYAQRFNRRHGRVGHLFQCNRGQVPEVAPGSHSSEHLDLIPANPAYPKRLLRPLPPPLETILNPSPTAPELAAAHAAGHTLTRSPTT